MGSLKAICFITACLALIGPDAISQTALISGNIMNGSTNQPIQADWVVLAKAGQGGMQTLQQLDKVSQFEFRNLTAQQGMPYLVRVSYEGVVYTKAVMVAGEKKYESDITVYEVTDKWSNIKVRVPHIVLARDGNILHVEQTFEIQNSGKFTLNLPDAKKPTFRFQLPTTAQIQSLTTTFGTNVPLAQPHFNYEDGLGINYPIRPGASQVQITYTMNYPDQVEFVSKWYYDISECNAFITPIDVVVKAEKFKKLEDKQMAENNFIIYSATNIKAGETLTLSLSGGSSIKKETAEEESTVKPASNEIQKLVWVIMPFFVGALMLVLYWGVTRKGVSNLNEEKEKLIQAIAEMDDLQAAQKIPDYDQKRKKLKKELFNILTEIEK